jgi:3-polyprenyl-4-hydroxybenzoate decarboxylase
MRAPWIVGVSGASGTPYARAVLNGLLDAGAPVDVVISRAARLTLLDETGLALTAAVLTYEHRIVRADDLSRVNRAFFTANGVIGVGLFGFALADLIVHGLGG